MSLFIQFKNAGKTLSLAQGKHSRIDAEAKESYHLMDSATGKTPVGTTVKQIGNNLLISMGDTRLEIANFFSDCHAGDTQCFVSLDAPTVDGNPGIATYTQDATTNSLLGAGNSVPAVGQAAEAAAAASQASGAAGAAGAAIPWNVVGIAAGAGVLAGAIAGNIASHRSSSTTPPPVDNVAPVNTIPATVNAVQNVATPVTGVSIADTDASASSVLVTTVNVVNGVLSTTATTGVVGNNTYQMTITGTKADINTALASLKYTPNAGFTGYEPLTISTNDQGNTGAGGAKTDTDMTLIHVVGSAGLVLDYNAAAGATNDTKTLAQWNTLLGTNFTTLAVDSTNHVITLGAGTTQIDFPNLAAVTTGLEKVTDTGSLTGFAVSSLSGITTLTDVSSTTATTVNNLAFSGCTALTNVNLPQVSTVGDNAFAGASLLASINLPLASSIGKHAFDTDMALTTVTLPAAVSVDDFAFANDPLLVLTATSLPLASSIGASAFANDLALTSITLPAATSIGASAFAGDTNTALTHINLPKVTSIGDNAFAGDVQLTDISLPNATTIGNLVTSTLDPGITGHDLNITLPASKDNFAVTHITTSSATKFVNFTFLAHDDTMVADGSKLSNAFLGGSLDGGTGVDALKFTGGSNTLDITLPGHLLNNIEVIDLTIGNNTLDINTASVLAADLSISSGAILKVIANALDVVQTTGGPSPAPTGAGTGLYALMTGWDLNTDGVADLYVSNGITVM